MVWVLVSFIGSPGSWKTTLAAKLFTDLKVGGNPCELLLEQARLYIAEKRARMMVAVRHLPLVLSDVDQHAIMERQLRWEQTLVAAAGPGSVVVTDTSPLNSLLYMSDIDHWYPTRMAQRAAQVAGVVFYSPPTGGDPDPDPNRIHGSVERAGVDDRIMPVLAKMAPTVLRDMVYLEGDFRSRSRTVHETVLGARPW